MRRATGEEPLREPAGVGRGRCAVAMGSVLQRDGFGDGDLEAEGLAVPGERAPHALLEAHAGDPAELLARPVGRDDASLEVTGARRAELHGHVTDELANALGD